MNKTATLLLAFALPGLAQTAPNQGAVAGNQSPANSKQAARTNPNADAQFATHVAQANMAEVALGKLAQEKAQSDDIKKFAQKMVDEHTKAEQDLEGIVAERRSSIYRPGQRGRWIKVKNPDSPAMIRARHHFARLGP